MPDQNDIIFDAYSVDFLAVLRAVYDFFVGSSISFESVVSAVSTGWTIFAFLAYAFSFACLYGILYAYLRDTELQGIELKSVEAAEEAWQRLYGAGSKNDRWTEIQQHIASDNPSDWKLAIIEADIILEKMLNDQGFAGATVAEKLRSASPNSFSTIEDAWDAHKVRNKVAHGAEDFVLTYKIARETITQYRRVFEEFGAI